jgi:hypothetical protein
MRADVWVRVYAHSVGEGVFAHSTCMPSTDATVCGPRSDDVGRRLGRSSRG